jgi:DNA-binding GntR family transcriptional regulator
MKLTGEERALISGRMSRKDTVLRILRSAILDGRLSAGTRLNQDLVATELGVSRMPVREAVKQLEAEGLLVVYPYRGVAVAQLDASSIEEMFHIRIALERLAVGRAVDRLDSTQLDAMERTLQDMDRLLQETPFDPNRWMQLNDAFHGILNQASGWSRLVETIAVFRGNVDRYVRTYLALRGREQPQKEHWAIYRACRDRDVLAAQALIEAHLLNTAEAVIRAAEQASSDSPAKAKAAG